MGSDAWIHVLIGQVSPHQAFLVWIASALGLTLLTTLAAIHVLSRRFTESGGRRRDAVWAVMISLASLVFWLLVLAPLLSLLF